MARRCWTCIGVLGLWLIAASAAAWGQESSPPTTEKSSPGVNERLAETLTLERLRLEQQFQQTAVKIQSLVQEIRRVQELERQRLGATLVPTHPRMLSLQKAQEKSERAVLTLQELVEKMNAAQRALAELGGESDPPRDDEERIRRIKGAYQSAFGNEVEMEALQRQAQAQAQAQTQAEVMEERMRKMEEYLLKTNFAAVEKARQQAEMKRAAQVLSALEELAQKQDANSQDQPDGESPSVPRETSPDKPEPAPGPRLGPSAQAIPFALQNQGPPAMVRPLYQPGPQAPSPEQIKQMEEFLKAMQQKSAPSGDSRLPMSAAAEQIQKLEQRLQTQSNTTTAAIDKRLEQVEGRLERIEALLQRLVPESPSKQD